MEPSVAKGIVSLFTQESSMAKGIVSLFTHGAIHG